LNDVLLPPLDCLTNVDTGENLDRILGELITFEFFPDELHGDEQDEPALDLLSKELQLDN
jgi:hypothetical protein